MFAVCVTFDLKTGTISEFLPKMKRQAELSRQLESDCHVFDICANPGDDAVFLYELYSDATAFQQHLKSRHFLAFDADTKEMVIAKTVRTYENTHRS